MMRGTHTYAELEVSASTYDEIAQKLKDAGYDHAFIDGAIDMHGIGLVRKKPTVVAYKPKPPPMRSVDQRHVIAINCKPRRVFWKLLIDQ